MIDRLSDNMIRYLLQQDMTVTTSTIADEIGVSTSSVKHNLEFIKKIIADSGAILHSTPGKGVWIEASHDHREDLLTLLKNDMDITSSPQYRQRYILDILCEYNSNYTIQLFAEELQVGRNIIVKDLEELEQWLMKFDLKIIRRRNMGVGIEGGEFNIRQAMIENHSEALHDLFMEYELPVHIDLRIDRKVYNYFRQLYGDFNFIEMLELMHGVERDLNVRFSDIDFVQLLEYIYVSVGRIKKENVIVEKNVLNKLDINNEQYTAAKNLFDTCIQVHKLYLGLEIRCLAAQFIVFGCNRGVEFQMNLEFYDEVSRYFLEHLKSIISNKKLIISEGLIHDLSLFFQKKKVEENYVVSRRHDVRQDIKQRFPSLYGICLTTIEEVESRLKISFTDDDIAYIVMLINNAMEECNHPYHAVFVTASDFHTSRYLANKIMNCVDGIMISSVINYEDIKESSITKFELIITTVPLDLEKNVVQVSKEISGEDLETLQHIIDEKGSLSIALNDVMTQVFNPGLIVCDYIAKRKEDVITKGCQLLYEKGYVKKGFEKKIWEREKTTPTSIGNSIAVPHGYKAYVKKSGIVVMRLKRPVNWTYEDRIEFVFLMAIDFNTTSQVYNFFQQFYAFIDDRTNIKALKNAKNELEIWEVLKHSGMNA